MAAKNIDSNVILLCSGGIDSTACCHFLLQNQMSVEALFIDYGQAAAEQESESAYAVCNFFSIPIQTFSFQPVKFSDSGEVAGRNNFLVAIALLLSSERTKMVAMGIHDGTSYRDCSRGFKNLSQRIFDFHSDGRIQFVSPFIDWSKAEIWDYSLSNNLPLHLTYSCEKGGTKPCGQCSSCKDLEVLNAG